MNNFNNQQINFNVISIADCLTDNSSLITFRSLRPRFINLLMNALRNENDSTNAQLLTVGLLTSVQDFVTRESETSHHLIPDSSLSSSGNNLTTRDTLSLSDDPTTTPGLFKHSSFDHDDDLRREGIPGTSTSILSLLPCHNSNCDQM